MATWEELRENARIALSIATFNNRMLRDAEKHLANAKECRKEIYNPSEKMIKALDHAIENAEFCYQEQLAIANQRYGEAEKALAMVCNIECNPSTCENYGGHQCPYEGGFSLDD